MCALPGSAVEADAAGDVALGGDVVALGDVAHRASGRDDRPAELVAQRQRRLDALRRPLVPAPDVQIGPADGRRLDPDEHLVRPGCRYGHLLEREPGRGLALADGAHRLHGGAILPRAKPAARAAIRSPRCRIRRRTRERARGAAYDSPLERLQLLGGDDEAIAAFLDEIDVRGPRDREMLRRARPHRPLARPERFEADHRRVLVASRASAATAITERARERTSACCARPCGSSSSSSRVTWSSRT